MRREKKRRFHPIRQPFSVTSRADWGYLKQERSRFLSWRGLHLTHAGRRTGRKRPEGSRKRPLWPKVPHLRWRREDSVPHSARRSLPGHAETSPDRFRHAGLRPNASLHSISIDLGIDEWLPVTMATLWPSLVVTSTRWVLVCYL